MGRKNRNARPRRQPWVLPANCHLMYSADELYREPIIVRYMGEQDDTDGTIKVWNPEGYEMWVHVSHVWLPRKVAA